MGGGALLDLGVYPASLAVHLFGPVAKTQAMVQRAANGVDLSAQLSLQHAAAAASFTTNLYAELANDAVISGTEGFIRLQRPLYAPAMLTLTKTGVIDAPDLNAPLPVAAANNRRAALKQALRPLRQAKPIYRPYTGDGFSHQIDEVHRCLAARLRESPIMPLAESVAVMEIMDQARAA
jgi:predicted dehydrogenase